MRQALLNTYLGFLMVAVISIISCTSTMPSDYSTTNRHLESTQQVSSEVSAKQPLSVKGPIHVVESVPFELTSDMLGTAFSVALTGGMRVGSEEFPYKLLIPELYTFDRIKFHAALLESGYTKGIADMFLGHQDCVVEVEGPLGGPVTFKKLTVPVISENGETIKGLAKPATMSFYGHVSSNPDLFQYSGTLLDINGVFVFGEQYAPWVVKGGTPEGQDCWVDIKNCIFLTSSNILYANSTTSISTIGCWFPIGPYEFLGNAEVFEGGLRLLPGSSYRKR